MKVNRLGQTKESFGAIARRIVAAAREEITLHREQKAIAIQHGLAVEAGREFLGAAVRRHRKRPGELHALLRAATINGKPQDLPLNAAPGSRHRVRTIGGADDEQVPYTLGMQLTERQRNHAAVRAAGNRME